MVLCNGKTEVSQGEFAFSLTLKGSIVIADGVTKIGKNAFYGCKNITSITLPDSVQTIEDCAFADCRALKKIIMYGVHLIGKNAFEGCDNLKTIYVDYNVQTNTESFRAFGINVHNLHVNNINEFTKHRNVFANYYTRHDFNLFEQNKKIKAITINNTIGEAALSGSTIEKLTLNKLTYVGHRSLYHMRYLKTLIASLEDMRKIENVFLADKNKVTIYITDKWEDIKNIPATRTLEYAKIIRSLSCFNSSNLPYKCAIYSENGPVDTASLAEKFAGNVFGSWHYKHNTPVIWGEEKK